MSEPKRYEAMGPEVIATPTGEFVKWDDYARLKAENKRLRKAGDAMVELLEQMDVVIDMNSDHPEVEAWNAAKEGKPSV